MIIMKHVLKTTSLALCAGLVAASALPALPSFIPSAHAASAASDPQTPIKALYAELTRIEAKNSGTFEQRSAELGPVIDRVYDLEAILSSSIGPHYATLSPDQKQVLLSTFRQFTIARNLSSFKPGTDARFTVNPATRDAPVGGNKIVDTQIGSSDDPSGTAVNYVMHMNGAKGYQVVDVLLNGNISQVGMQHSDFRAALSGGNVQNLIDLLQKKIKVFSEG